MGYGAIVRDSFFLNLAQVWTFNGGAWGVNGLLLQGNFIQGGNSTTNAVEFANTNAGGDRSNIFRDNIIEMSYSGGLALTHNYLCAFNLHNAFANLFEGNEAYDGDSQATLFCGDSTATGNNIMKSNYLDQALGMKYTNSTWSDNNYMPYRSINFSFDGGGSGLVAPITRCQTISFGGAINKFSMTADQTGSASVQVLAVPFGSYTGPTSATDISGGGEAMTSAVKLADTTLTGWSYGINASSFLSANTVVCFKLNSATTVNWISGSVQVLEGR
jgi:hypothetical protein